MRKDAFPRMPRSQLVPPPRERKNPEAAAKAAEAAIGAVLEKKKQAKRFSTKKVVLEDTFYLAFRKENQQAKRIRQVPCKCLLLI
eukprot:1139545-Pelagomonas_calceolata.AAC.1